MTCGRTWRVFINNGNGWEIFRHFALEKEARDMMIYLSDFYGVDNVFIDWVYL